MCVLTQRHLALQLRINTIRSFPQRGKRKKEGLHERKYSSPPDRALLCSSIFMLLKQVMASKKGKAGKGGTQVMDDKKEKEKRLPRCRTKCSIGQDDLNCCSRCVHRRV
jgi:hypothetical protein